MQPSLWNRDPTGPCFTLSLMSSRVLSLTISERVLNIARHLITQHSQNNLEAFLIAKFTLFHVDHIGIAVERVEYQLSKPGKATCLPEELLIPFKLSKRGIPARSYDIPVQELWRNLTMCIPSLELTSSFRVMARMALARQESTGNLEAPQLNLNFAHLDFDTLFIDCLLRINPIPMIPLVQSALSRSLETSLLYPSANLPRTRNMLDPAWDARFGYISATSCSKFALHLDMDPTVISSTLVGIWISGVEYVSDPRVWTLCMRFLMSDRYMQPDLGTSPVTVDRGTIHKRDSMVLIFYGITSGPPACYDVGWKQDSRMDSLMPTEQASTLPPGLHFKVFTTSANRPMESNGKLIKFYLEEPQSPLSDCRSLLSTIVARQLLGPSDAVGLPESSPAAVVQLPRCEQTTTNVSSSQAKQHACNNQIERPGSSSTSSFNVPEVSLLLEEGVATTSSQLLMTKSISPVRITQETLSPHAADAIPRHPPSHKSACVRSSPCVVNDPGNQSPVLDVSYDPRRYQLTKQSCTQPTATPASNSSTETASPKVKISDTCPQSSPTGLQSLLAKLPQSQLKRLEEMISVLLSAKNTGQTPRQLSSPNDKQRTELERTCTQASVDVGVNTTLLQSGLASPNQRNLSSPRSCRAGESQPLSISNPLATGISELGATHLDDRSIRSPTKSPTTSTKQEETNGARCHEVDALRAQIVSGSPPTLAKLQSTLSLNSDIPGSVPTVTHINQKLPDLQFGYPSQNPVGRNPASAVNEDRFSDLLAGIQGVLNRQTKTQQQPLISECTNPTIHTTNTCTYTTIPAWSPSPVNVGTGPIIQRETKPNVRPATSLNTRSAQRTPPSQERVANWLSTENRSINVVSRPDIVNEDRLSGGLDETVQSGHFPSTQTIAQNTNPANWTLSSSLTGAKLCEYQSLMLSNSTSGSKTEAPTTATFTSQPPIEMDQSVFLATLVEKYLGMKIPSTSTGSGMKAQPQPSHADVTCYGGLNPNDMSMATQSYLERHNILEVNTGPNGRDGHPRRFKSVIQSSTPAFGPSLVSSQAFHIPLKQELNNKNEPNRFPSARGTENHDPINFSQSESLMPNVLDDIQLDRSPLADTFANHDPDVKMLLPPLTETSSLFSFVSSNNNSTLIDTPSSGTTRDEFRSDSGSGNENGRILDIERLRSLPKLL